MIIAVDFDGILCSNCFPGIGEPNYEMILVVRQLMDEGHEVVLWTCRVEKQLEEAVKWCEDRGMHFCAVNDNAPSNKAKFDGVYAESPRKIYADVYIDDHDPNFTVMRHVFSNGVAVDSTINLIRRILKWQEEN